MSSIELLTASITSKIKHTGVHLNHGLSPGPYLQVNKVMVTFILMLPRRTGSGGRALFLISAVDLSGEFCTSAALREVTTE
jgi:hypothetical protein